MLICIYNIGIYVYIYIHIYIYIYIYISYIHLYECIYTFLVVQSCFKSWEKYVDFEDRLAFAHSNFSHVWFWSSI